MIKLRNYLKHRKYRDARPFSWNLENCSGEVITLDGPRRAYKAVRHGETTHTEVIRVVVPEGARVVVPENYRNEYGGNNKLRTDKLFIDETFVKRRKNVFVSSADNTEYHSWKLYEEPHLNIDVTRECARGLHFCIKGHFASYWA